MGTQQGSEGRTSGAARKPVLTLTRKDFRIEYFRGSGAGGQNRNKRDTACRVVHTASGAASECQEERSANQNFRIAFERLAEKPRFKMWLSGALMDHAAVDLAVAAAAQPENIRTEVQVDGRWTICTLDVLSGG